MGIRLEQKQPSMTDIKVKVDRIERAIAAKTVVGDTINVYTDGSTQAKDRKSKNSGYGIYVTKQNHDRIVKCGGIARTDGNNFAAEMAAVAVFMLLSLHRDRYIYRLIHKPP